MSYYSVIFIANLNENVGSDYLEMDQKMAILSKSMPGYLGADSISNGNHEISISYWRNEESIKNWHQNELHKVAQKLGKEKWFKSLHIRIAKVDREYQFG